MAKWFCSACLVGTMTMTQAVLALSNWRSGSSTKRGHWWILHPLSDLSSQSERINFSWRSSGGRGAPVKGHVRSGPELDGLHQTFRLDERSRNLLAFAPIFWCLLGKGTTKFSFPSRGQPWRQWLVGALEENGWSPHLTFLSGPYHFLKKPAGVRSLLVIINE